MWGHVVNVVLLMLLNVWEWYGTFTRKLMDHDCPSISLANVLIYVQGAYQVLYFREWIFYRRMKTELF